MNAIACESFRPIRIHSPFYTNFDCFALLEKLAEKANYYELTMQRRVANQKRHDHNLVRTAASFNPCASYATHRSGRLQFRLAKCLSHPSNSE